MAFFSLGISLTALKIHCSEACKVLLEQLGGYVIQERGDVYIKGKGDMKTYWIEGELDSKKCRQRRCLQHPCRSPSVRWVRSACNSLRNQASEPGRLSAAARLLEQGKHWVENDTAASTPLWRRGHSCPSLDEPESQKTCSTNCDRVNDSTISGSMGSPAEREPFLKDAVDQETLEAGLR